MKRKPLKMRLPTRLWERLADKIDVGLFYVISGEISDQLYYKLYDQTANPLFDELMDL